MNAPLEVARTLSLLRRKKFLGFANELLGLLVFSLSHKPFRKFRASLRLVLIAVHLVRRREFKLQFILFGHGDRAKMVQYIAKGLIHALSAVTCDSITRHEYQYDRVAGCNRVLMRGA